MCPTEKGTVSGELESLHGSTGGDDCAVTDGILRSPEFLLNSARFFPVDDVIHPIKTSATPVKGRVLVAMCS